MGREPRRGSWFNVLRAVDQVVKVRLASHWFAEGEPAELLLPG